MSPTRLCAMAALAVLLLVSIHAAQTPAPAPLPFSSARKAGGTLYVSGQLPRTPAGQEVHGSIEAETRQVMDNIGRILQENGYSFDDVVSATVYLQTMADYQQMNQVYASYFGSAFPARACVGGLELAFGFRVEISCIAHREAP
ncbi:MAG: Rid family detoxifying hydrolase [Candidatus Latescibacterota bacterium]